MIAVLAAAAPAAAHGDLELLRRHAPTLHYDARDPERATSVEALGAARPSGDRIALVPRQDPLPDVVYGRALAARDGRTWLQYWMLYRDNPQDRGVLRTGRHEGDWEVVQVALDHRGRPVEATYAQHSWAERCDGWSGDVFVANGSHASYPVAGQHDRPWPDPDDEARGDGRTVRPRVESFGAWASWPGRWGRSEASWIPGESDSPRGPAHQPAGPWGDPSGFHARARACGSGAPGHPAIVRGAAGGAALLLGATLLALKVARRQPNTPDSRVR